MEEEVLLFGGRVRKRSLPIFQGPPPPGATGPMRLRLAQGELANLYNDPEGIRYLAFLELQPGGIRGNHFHRKKIETFYVVSGEVLVGVKETQTSDLVSFHLAAGDLLRIEPEICHAFKPTTAGEAIEFSPGLFDPADAYRVGVL